MHYTFANISLAIHEMKPIMKHDEVILQIVHSHYFEVTIALIVTSFLLYWLFFMPINWSKIDQNQEFGSAESPHFNNKHVAINRLRKRRTIGMKELPPPYPNGWYGIVESSQLKAGKSMHISCLGEQLVVYRSQNNKVYILNAYCPHLGANLSQGGRVIGDNIECPFHHWSFRGSDGICTNIPYSDNIPSTTRIKKWTSAEENGFIFLWYNVEESDIPWSIPKSFDVASNKLVYHGRNEFYINCHIQEIPENGADLAHFRAIHNDNIVTCKWSKPLRFLRKLGHHQWSASWNRSDVKHIAEIKMSHTFYLFGKYPCFHMNIEGKQIGPAFVHLVLKSPTFGSFEIFQTITPVDPLVQKVVHTFYSTRLVAPILKFFIFGETVMRDMEIWNHKLYRSSPILVTEEAPLKKFRKWYAQFYTVNSKQFQVACNQDW